MQPQSHTGGSIIFASSASQGVCVSHAVLVIHLLVELHALFEENPGVEPFATLQRDLG